MTVDRPVDDELQKAFRTVVSGWLVTTAMYRSDRGTSTPGATTTLPKYSATKTTLVAVGDEFDRARKPTVDLLANMLQVFHLRVAPIRSAVLEVA